MGELTGTFDVVYLGYKELALMGDDEALDLEKDTVVCLGDQAANMVCPAASMHGKRWMTPMNDFVSGEVQGAGFNVLNDLRQSNYKKVAKIIEDLVGQAQSQQVDRAGYDPKDTFLFERTIYTETDEYIEVNGKIAHKLRVGLLVKCRKG